MKRNIRHETRDRYLTPEEAAKYRAIREQIEAEKPEINARIRANLERRGDLDMTKELLDRCPACGLVVLSGAIFDAVQQAETYGPILGIHKEARSDTALAGYVGISSLWMGDVAPDLYRCPRCRTELIVSS
jgi:uncharacterized protein with PIN domain